MRRIFFLLVCLIISVFPSCSIAGLIPKEGDLVFEVSEPSAFSEAITDATAREDSIKCDHVAIPNNERGRNHVTYDHVAIFHRERGRNYVIEASTVKGVVLTKWKDFVDSSVRINGKPGLSVMRVNADFPLSKAVARAKSFIGEEYDWSFLPDNGKMYCSELVYCSYRYEDGKPIFTERPMNFRDSKGAMPDFWTKLFQRLGEKIPERVPGTNPNDMSKEPVLKEVHRYF